jgi:hypothetical protein
MNECLDFCKRRATSIAKFRFLIFLREPASDVGEASSSSSDLSSEGFSISIRAQPLAVRIAARLVERVQFDSNSRSSLISGSYEIFGRDRHRDRSLRAIRAVSPNRSGYTDRAIPSLAGTLSRRDPDS